MLGRRMGTAGAVAAGALSARQQRLRPSQCSAGGSAAAAALSTSAAAPGGSSAVITVYQYAICPFCSKVKTYLDFLKQPYETVEVNPLTKGELGFSKEYKKVPIIQVGATQQQQQQQVNDSEAIIAYITSELKAKEKCGARFFPADAEKWTEWCDKKLAVMLYPNITRTMEESWECFGYVDKVKSWNVANQFVTRAAGTVAMSLANGKIKKKYGIVDERAELKATLAEWTGAVGSKKFLHGDYITLPDLMVFGVLRSIAGLTTWNEIMAGDAALKAWYARMEAAVPSAATKAR